MEGKLLGTYQSSYPFLGLAFFKINSRQQNEYRIWMDFFNFICTHYMHFYQNTNIFEFPISMRLLAKNSCQNIMHDKRQGFIEKINIFSLQHIHTGIGVKSLIQKWSHMQVNGKNIQTKGDLYTITTTSTHYFNKRGIKSGQLGSYKMKKGGYVTLRKNLPVQTEQLEAKMHQDGPSYHYPIYRPYS